MLVGVLLAVCAVMLLAATASARERLRERAMVRALDGSPRGLFGHVVAEAFLVALAGGVLGLVASTTFNWVDKFMASEWNLTLELDPARQLGALASVLLVSLLAALWPAWKASTVNVAGQIAELPDRAA
jgi:putative ABC transport system permease protein